MIWPHASKQHPCPICGKEDWCTYGDRMVLCQRIESVKPHSKGGWFHPYDSTKTVTKIPITKKQTPASLANAGYLMQCFRTVTPEWQYKVLANDLGVFPDSLKALGVAYSTMHQAFAFPMYDGDGKVCGIRLRNREGKKWAVAGSKQGIFLPNFQPVDKVVYLPEGPTDVAALLSMGLFAIGRPSCLAGFEIIKATLERLKIYKAVIVSDNDELKAFGSKKLRPGLDGANKLKQFLRIKSVIWIAPSPNKDVRAFYKNGGTGSMIKDAVNQLVWTK